MLSVYKDTTTDQMWGTFTEYDSSGRAILNANPSAVLLPTSLATIEAYPDLLHSVSGNYQYLSDTAGQITVTGRFKTSHLSARGFSPLRAA